MQRHQDVIDAATRLFSEKGEQATTVDEIAKEAGIAKGTFYKMFGSKDELIQQIMKQFLASNYELLHYVQQMPTESGREKLEKFCSLVMGYIYDQRHFLLSYILPHGANTHDIVKIIPTFNDFEKQLMNLTKELFLSAYGPKVEPFIWDIVYIFGSVHKEFSFHVIRHQSPMTIDKTSKLISTILDYVVQHFLDQTLQPVITTKQFDEIMGSKSLSVDKESQVTELLKAIERKIAALLSSESLLARELAEAMGSLNDELGQSKPRTGVIKALLNFLKQDEELNHICTRLEGLIIS